VSFQHCGAVRGADDDDDDDDVVVQEDPQWWKHLPSLKCIGLGCLVVKTFMFILHSFSATTYDVRS